MITHNNQYGRRLVLGIKYKGRGLVGPEPQPNVAEDLHLSILRIAGMSDLLPPFIDETSTTAREIWDLGSGSIFGS